MQPVPVYPNLTSSPCECRTHAVRRGYYFRSSDRARVQRYLCQRCGKSFSDATSSFCYMQKKRQFNQTIFKLLTGGYSQRRAALDLKLNRKTVVRTFLLLGKVAQDLLELTRSMSPEVTEMEFDELETFEHSKCKPLSIHLAVEHKTRRILGVKVARMPAKGPLAKLAMKRYGPREDQRKQKREELMEELKSIISPNAVIKSDQNPHYPQDVKKHFPNCRHKRFKGRRGCVVGQGELKRGGFDPLFSLNHTAAMLRANINRLFRRTWCTTKQKERLALHIALYVEKHN